MISSPLRVDMSDLSGTLLVATPVLQESVFSQAVIYICHHSPEKGAMGVVINKKLERPNFTEFLKHLDIEPTPKERSISIHSGGPVEKERGLVLHSTDWQGEDSVKLSSHVAVTASIDILKSLASGEGPRDVILAMGYAGWGGGQLEKEILYGDSWVIAPATEELIFGKEDAVKWHQVMNSVNIDPKRFAGTGGRA